MKERSKIGNGSESVIPLARASRRRQGIVFDLHSPAKFARRATLEMAVKRWALATE